MTAARRCVDTSVLLATIAVYCLAPVDAQVQAPPNAAVGGDERVAALDRDTVWESRIGDDKGGTLTLENGGIVKVTSGDVGDIGDQRESVVFWDGTSWKIWIEGKRAFPCDLLKRPPSGPTNTERLTIDTITNDGDILITSGGAVFEVSSGTTPIAWTPGVSVLLLGKSRMLNVEAGRVIEVSRLR